MWMGLIHHCQPLCVRGRYTALLVLRTEATYDVRLGVLSTLSRVLNVERRASALLLLPALIGGVRTSAQCGLSHMSLSSTSSQHPSTCIIRGARPLGNACTVLSAPHVHLDRLHSQARTKANAGAWPSL